MPENYQATQIVGEKYKRASLVTIDNPLGGQPRITFHEADVVVAADGTSVISSLSDSCTLYFDAENPLHTEIYQKLNEVYVVAREARDAQRLADQAAFEERMASTPPPPS